MSSHILSARKLDILDITETRLSAQTVTNVDIFNYDLFHTKSPTLAGKLLVLSNDLN